MAAASSGHHKSSGLKLILPALVAGVMMLAATGFDALAGGAPIDPVPNPRPRPGYTPTASAPTAARAETAAVVRKTGGRGDALSNINAYFNGFKTMQGQFIQFGPHGEQSEGDFYIARPGKIRFKYNPPVTLDVIADGRNVAIRNTRTATQDYYPLGKTPLRYLLADNIDLTSGIVNEVRQEPDLIALIIVEDSRLVKGKLTLIFDKQTYELKQWIVTDAQGLNTSVAVYNTTTGARLDPGLFKINYYQ